MRTIIAACLLSLLTAFPAAAQSPVQNTLGISIVPLTSEVRRAQRLPGGVGGLIIAQVDPGSPAADLGLKRTDVILGASGRPVSTASELRKAVVQAKHDGRKAVLLKVERGGNVRLISVPLGN